MGDAYDFIDTIYDAAYAPEGWAPVMERLADMVGGDSGWLSQINVRDGSGGHLNDPVARIDEIWPRRYLDYFASRNPIAIAKDADTYLRDWVPIIVTHDDQIRRDDLVQTEFFNDFLRPQDVSSAMMIRLARFGAETATININCSFRRGRFDPADVALARQFQPHLIRAFKLGRRLSEARAIDGGAASLFEQSSHGLFLVDGQGRIRRLNPVAESLLAEAGGLCSAGGRLSARQAESARRLAGLIAAAAAADPSERTGGALALPTPTRALPLSVTVSPIRAERAWSYHVGPSVMVCVADLDSGAAPTEAQVRQLFGLTAAEARLALALCRGRSPRQAAADFGVSYQTVRSQLTRIFDKTRTHRQADLAHLLSRAAAGGLG